MGLPADGIAMEALAMSDRTARPSSIKRTAICLIQLTMFREFTTRQSYRPIVAASMTTSAAEKRRTLSNGESLKLHRLYDVRGAFPL